MTETDDAPFPLSRRRRMAIYYAALITMFMAVLDMQIVATALPTIASDLGNLELFSWVGSAYLLTTAAVTPFYGKLGDMFGRKRIFVVAIVIFTIGSLVCGLARSMEALIAARVLQGIGGGGLMTLAFAIIADLFEPRERAKYQGYSTAVFAFSALIGPVGGGIIAQSIGWPFIFLINLPVGVVAIAILVLTMPAPAKRRRPTIDYLGGFLLAAIVTMIVFWAENTLAGGEFGLMTIVLPVLIVVALAVFIFVERRAPEPVIPLKFFSNRTISLALAVSILVGTASLGMLNYFALFLQTVIGLSPAQAGLLFLPASAGTLLASIGSGIAVSRTGRYKIFPVAAMALGVCVMLAFSLVTPDTPVWQIGILMFCFSGSMGLQMQTILMAVQNAAPRADVGAATSSVALARLMGSSIGVAANGGLLTAGLLYGQSQLSQETVAQLPGEIGDMTPQVIAKLPPEIAVQIVNLFDHAFNNIFYLALVLFAAGLVLALSMEDVRLPMGKSDQKQDKAKGDKSDASVAE